MMIHFTTGSIYIEKFKGTLYILSKIENLIAVMSFSSTSTQINI
jgi:hypothetical protein